MRRQTEVDALFEPGVVVRLYGIVGSGLVTALEFANEVFFHSGTARHPPRQYVALQVQPHAKVGGWFDPSGKLSPHGRPIVIDGAIALLGSIALSAKSLNGRREVAVLIRQPDLVAKLDRQFNKGSDASNQLQDVA